MTTIHIAKGELHKVPRFTYLRVVTPAHESVFNDEVCDGKFLLLTTGETDSEGDLVFCAVPVKGHAVTGASPFRRTAADRFKLQDMDGRHGVYVQFLRGFKPEQFEVITDLEELRSLIGD